MSELDVLDQLPIGKSCAINGAVVQRVSENKYLVIQDGHRHRIGGRNTSPFTAQHLVLNQVLDRDDPIPCAHCHRRVRKADSAWCSQCHDAKKREVEHSQRRQAILQRLEAIGRA